MFACSPGPLVPAVWVQRLTCKSARRAGSTSTAFAYSFLYRSSWNSILPCTFSGCSENQRMDCFLFVCKTSSRHPASVHVALTFDTSMLHDEMLSLCAFCIQCFVNIFVPIKCQRVTALKASMLVCSMLVAVLVRSGTRHAYYVP